MRNKYVFTFVLLVCLSLIGTGVIQLSKQRNEGYDSQKNADEGTDAKSEEDEGDLKVVTSFYPMYIAAMNVVDGIPGVELINLTEPQTGCLHDYQMTPQDLIELSTADVFVVNGGGIEGFVEEAASSCPSLTIVTASDGITYLGTEMESDHDHEHFHGDGHDHGDINAHVWMDVNRYIQEIENIAEALGHKDPSNAEAYHNNAHEYREKLQVLCKELEILNGKAEGKKIVIFHDAFAYFADAFDMEVAAIIPMDEDTSLSANQVSEIVTLVNEEQVDMLFTEAQYGTKLADAISRETDAKVYVLDSLVTGEIDKDNYILGMTGNLNTLKEAFGGEE